MDEEESLPAVIRSDLGGIEISPTVGDVSMLLAAGVAQQEAMLSIFAILGKACPQMILTDDFQKLRRSLLEASEDLAVAAKRMAERGGLDVEGS